MILRKAGATVEIAENGVTAVEMVGRMAALGTPYDLILMDMQMPQMDGYEAVRTLRSNGIPSPIIALTAHAMSTDRDRCLAAGCNDYAVKPLDRAKLLETCARWLAACARQHTPA